MTPPTATSGLDASSAPAPPTTAAPATADTRTLAQAARNHAVDALIREQHPDGHWCAELEGDSILNSEYILLKWIIEQEDDPRLPAIAAYLRRLQQPDGSWVQYPGAKTDLSATVKGYLALKLCGDDPEAPHMAAARERILALGGAERINSFSKFYLACLGQVRYSAIPSIPPQIVFLPHWFYFNLDNVSAWTRTMITPLSIVTTHRPARQLPEHLHIDELFCSQRDRHRLLPGPDAHPFWTPVFLGIDRVLKTLRAVGLAPGREAGLKWIERWIVEHTDRSDGLGAIFPPMVYILIALRCRGYADDHPVIQEAHHKLDELMIHDEDTVEIRIQPCFSPVWDTGIAAYALTEAGLDSDDPSLGRCADWLVSKECRQAGDWVANVKQPVEPSGWYFEYRNEFYPDVDDTAMVAMALKQAGGPEAEAAGRRGAAWMLAMQNDDGGWAAFDRTKHRQLLEYVPFADHNAIQDPSCPDITGRVLESLGRHGYTPEHPAVRRAVEYLKRTQHACGGWFGRWGVNYVYGTWQVVCGLEIVGVDLSESWVQRAGQWLRSVQHEDGAFGESANSYEDLSLIGQGPATASQTAWGVMAMLSLFGPDDPDVERGIRWLCQTQLPSGSWEESWFTGTGFPKVFYLRYHLYRLYFPVMCLGRWCSRRVSRR